MSYQAAAALQAALYQTLTAAPALAGVAVFDAIPSGAGSGTYVLLGPETVLDRSDQTGPGAEHQVQISVISDAAGFQEAKTVAAGVAGALDGAAPVLATGHLVALSFHKAVARRLDEGEARRIDLTYRARIEI